MSDLARSIIADTLQPALAPDDAQDMARRIVARLDEAADAPAFAPDDVVQIAHTAPACGGCLAHVEDLRADGRIKLRMPAADGNHGFVLLLPEHLIPTGGSITPARIAP